MFHSVSNKSQPGMGEFPAQWLDASRLDQAREHSVKLALANGCKLAAEPAILSGWVETGVETEALAQH